jgi:hypothetical protein
LRGALTAAVNGSPPHPEVVERAAKDFGRGVVPALFAEVRWAFTPPRIWLSGLLVNLALAAAWLLVQPLNPQGLTNTQANYHHAGWYHHQQIDWVVLISTYFASFVLADVTTTNLLGADHHRVAKGLSQGVPFWRVLLIKNLALLVIVGLPTLLVAAALTLARQSPAQLGDTIPNVAVPIISWLGVGNLVSVLLPVGAEPLAQRWRQRDDWRRTLGWVTCLTLPYGLYYIADPMGGIDHNVWWTQIPAAIGPVFGRDSKSFVHLGVALIVWAVGSLIAVLWVRKRGLQFR